VSRPAGSEGSGKEWWRRATEEEAVAEVPGGGIVLRPGEARTIDVGGFTVSVHADGATTQGAFSLIESAEGSPGGPPLHIHRDAAESFYVLRGEYVMHLDGRDFQCPEGSFIYVPAGMRHTFRSIAAGSRKLNLFTPAAMVGYFDDLAAAIVAGIDERGLDEIAGRYNMDVVGPIPEGYL
jgi:mannose-6-phosphate isomerase-like protein (cupin superfamily)